MLTSLNQLTIKKSTVAVVVATVASFDSPY
jgi:hypothetical protein